LLWRSVGAMWKSAAAARDGRLRREERDLSPKIVAAGVIALIVVIACLSKMHRDFFGEDVSVLGAVLIALLITIFGFFFVAVTSRIVGIIGGSSCPISGMTIATLLVCTFVLRWAGFEGIPGQVAALSVGAVVCIAISLAADTSQDLKTGFLVGATPNRQQIGEMIGVLCSAMFIGVTIFLLHDAYTIGSSQLPAPQAWLMSKVIPGVLQGDMPWALVFIGCGTALVVELFGIASLPFAVGLYLPITLTTPIMIGGILHWLLVGRRSTRRDGTMEVTNGVLFASGLIAGEGLIAVFFALLITVNVWVLPEDYAWLDPWVTWVAFGLLAVTVARVDWRRAKR